MQELLETILKNVPDDQKIEIETAYGISMSYKILKEWFEKFDEENVIDLLLLNTFSGLFSFFVQELKKIKSENGMYGKDLINLMAACLEDFIKLMRKDRDQNRK